ncbi:MAG: ABC-ATPase domain-containing protein [Proteobacteria bacterium]|nr:ABC-ATPase domain-containing protein [Pseudomonadota bacterium]
MDEDSSAANFLIKDQKMRKLIPEDAISPFFLQACAVWNWPGRSIVLETLRSARFRQETGQAMTTLGKWCIEGPRGFYPIDTREMDA